MFKLRSYQRLWRYQYKRLSNHLSLLSDPVLRQVITKGYAVIPHYWDSARCEKARLAIDSLLSTPQVKVWRDPVNADERIMGADRLSPDLDLIQDPIINRMIERLYGSSDLAKFTLAARLSAVKGNAGSGQGWHRDSAFVYQFKAILYLSDVTQETGPFEYYKGSGNALSMLKFERDYGFSVDQNRFTDSEIEQTNLKHVQQFCANQGSLLLVNTRGLHRGKPILFGKRYALTNYYWPSKIPEHMQSFVN
ncbi:hypothetical protein Glaag_1269 [Glaciecola sp. 4H-3-7+YE-5]|uniref:Phytanoyl-CoA dioxygenase n=1 Tax=Paraglaciecola agarilytica NO2 TaxID=1125747 RepID=A0ABQ0I7Z7_9ALTE|nr:phytanoyl-CoA dioxygenase family protein [Paraglaciecola agarilytica]AEE22230.1 hypothetical protein Glaag_1269 [Glaciecola sp. 4H-3-7+YE-5]GAC05478.1 hypothetical protein GAGA_2634 [Paraglaciecola agarilytica NO2]